MPRPTLCAFGESPHFCTFDRTRTGLTIARPYVAGGELHTSISSISMGFKRKSGHSAAGKAGNHQRWGGHAAADDEAPEDRPVAAAASEVQPLPVATAAAEPIDAGAGAHHSGSSRYPWQAPH